MKINKKVPWNKGISCSEETKAKIRTAHIGKKHSLESKRKMSLARKGKKPYIMTDEIRNNMSKARKEVKLSEEHKQKIKISLMGERNHFFGKKHSLEAREKISKARSKYANEEDRQIGKLKQMKEYRRLHYLEQIKKQKDYYYAHQQKILAEKKLYGKRTRKARNLYQKNKKKVDIQYRLKTNLTSSLWSAVKKGKNSGKRGGSAIKNLGCTISELIIHLEKQFKLGMTWNNWSINGWHIDHIIPLDYFNLTDLEEVKKACHYTNLQPMWAKENIVKSNKVLNASKIKTNK